MKPGAQQGGVLARLSVPERFNFSTPGTPTGEPRHIEQMYKLFARAIGGEATGLPDFATALRRHRLIDTIRESSDTGRTVTFA